MSNTINISQIKGFILDYKYPIIIAFVVLVIVFFLFKKSRKNPTITDANLQRLAKKFDIEPEVIKAVQKIESSGNGYLSDGRPKILFERHVFWKRLQEKGLNPSLYQKGNEDILSPNSGGYGQGGANQWARLERAMKINKEAALESASWGDFQILGMNYKKAGYNSVNAFVNAIKNPKPTTNLEAFLNFCNNKKPSLLIYLRGKNKNWAAFAKGYNGAGYKKNQYDTKLQKEYEKLKNP